VVEARRARRRRLLRRAAPTCAERAHSPSDFPGGAAVSLLRVETRAREIVQVFLTRRRGLSPSAFGGIFRKRRIHPRHYRRWEEAPDSWIRWASKEQTRACCARSIDR